MSATGKRMRLRRLIEPGTGKSVIFAISHGTTSPVLLKGTEDIVSRVAAAHRGGANVVFLSAGYARHCVEEFEKAPNLSLTLKISSTAAGYHLPHQEVLFGSVQQALCLGADGVVVLVPLSKENEREIIRWLGRLGEECERYGMPLLAEAEFPTAYHKTESVSALEKYGIEYLRRSVRLCTELGADIIKTNWTGDQESFAEIVTSTPVPVVVAGGSRESSKDLLKKIHLAIGAGAVGCSVGRNIFQHKDPEAMTRAISMVVKEGKSVESACSYLREVGAEGE